MTSVGWSTKRGLPKEGPQLCSGQRNSGSALEGKSPLFSGACGLPAVPKTEGPGFALSVSGAFPEVALEIARLAHNRQNVAGRREKTLTPKTRFSIWTLLRTPGRFTTRPLPCAFYHKIVCSKAVFGP